MRIIKKYCAILSRQYCRGSSQYVKCCVGMQSSSLPLTPHHGSWHAACSPETQRCQLALQPHPAHAAVYGTCSSEYWPALPTGINKTHYTILYHDKCEPESTFKPQLIIYKGKIAEDTSQIRNNKPTLTASSADLLQALTFSCSLSTRSCRRTVFLRSSSV